jgi:hypothetical protein
LLLSGQEAATKLNVHAHSNLNEAASELLTLAEKSRSTVKS